MKCFRILGYKTENKGVDFPITYPYWATADEVFVHREIADLISDVVTLNGLREADIISISAQPGDLGNWNFMIFCREPPWWRVFQRETRLKTVKL